MFGEIAVERGYLKKSELEELLMIQKNEHITLGESLVQKGYMTLAELLGFRPGHEPGAEKASSLFR